jgi:hypothetical protein
MMRRTIRRLAFILASQAIRGILTGDYRRIKHSLPVHIIRRNFKTLLNYDMELSDFAFVVLAV